MFLAFLHFFLSTVEGSRDYWEYMFLRLGSSSCACHPCDQDGFGWIWFVISPTWHQLLLPFDTHFALGVAFVWLHVILLFHQLFLYYITFICVFVKYTLHSALRMHFDACVVLSFNVLFSCWIHISLLFCCPYFSSFYKYLFCFVDHVIIVWLLVISPLLLVAHFDFLCFKKLTCFYNNLP